MNIAMQYAYFGSCRNVFDAIAGRGGVCYFHPDVENAENAIEVGIARHLVECIEDNCDGLGGNLREWFEAELRSPDGLEAHLECSKEFLAEAGVLEDRNYEAANVIEIGKNIIKELLAEGIE